MGLQTTQKGQLIIKLEKTCRELKLELIELDNHIYLIPERNTIAIFPPQTGRGSLGVIRGWLKSGYALMEIVDFGDIEEL